jgi:hypothetical protein
MALEVSEIGIRLRVDDGAEEDDDETKDPVPGTCAESLDRGEIVDDCVRRVLQILQRQRER